MTMPIQISVARKTETVPNFRGRSLRHTTPSPYLPSISTQTASFDLDNERTRAVGRIYIYELEEHIIIWPLSEQIFGSAARENIPASAGIPVAKDVEIAPARILDPDLRDALRDLDGTTDEAREEGIPVPSDTAQENARRILRAMYELSPRRYEIYPMPDGEVAVDAPGGFGRSVLLLCESDGGALCLVNMSGSHRRARYSDAAILPDGFVREALAELDSRSEPVA